MAAWMRKCYAPRLAAGLVAIVLAVAVGVGVGVARAHDSNLDLADAHLEKAAALLAASAGPTWDEKSSKEFEKAVAQAIDDIGDARAQIAEAAAVSDGALPPP